MNNDQEPMIEIHDLTDEQVEMLDTMWAIDNHRDFIHFVKSLSSEKQQQVLTLSLMVQQEYLELDLARMSSYRDADQLISKIKQKYKN